ncbi:hypothetical protein Lnau_2328 [Legionella nautarum]|uniref:HEAT repeat protein n=1 Tax=Legionella nautarum TaxID=45070 RepID=A0A0W0WMP0_9GAMM|nr:hypothetical protein Lnau_2328 [Legionella nautarum]
MKKIIIFIFIYAFSSIINAENIVDVYGVNPNISESVIKNYGSQVGEIEAKFTNEIIKLSNGSKDEKALNSILLRKNELIEKIKQKYSFSFVDFNTVLYPNDKNTYTTIEVITQNDKSRLRFVHKKTPNTLNQKPKHDLITKMIEFQQIQGQLMLNNQFGTKGIECPVYHCLPNFDHPELKDLFSLFNSSVVKEKELILSTINHDSDPERRTAAVYLMGYLNEPNEIISFLTDHILDIDEGVRNAAMRVIGETMLKAKIAQINVLPYLSLLESPYETDRNKALLVLCQAVSSKQSRELIIRQGKSRLLSLLRLKQPNNKNAVYELLKKISGKDFSSANYRAWEQWFSKSKA